MLFRQRNRTAGRKASFDVHRCCQGKAGFISYLNPEFKEIIRYLTLIEFIDGKENNDKLKILFGELEKYYHYLNIQYLNNNTLNI